MARICGACCGLLVFSAMIVCGLMAENPAGKIVLRALYGLMGGFALGTVSGWIGTLIVKENTDTAPGDNAESPEEDDKPATETRHAAEKAA